MKIFAILAAALMTMASVAKADTAVDYSALQAQTMATASQFAGLKWKVGDKASYTVDIGGFIKGTSENYVRDVSATDIWMVQDMDLGFAGKQKIEIDIDAGSGQIKKILANGQEQQIPSAADQEIVEMKQDHITVAAGAFDCIYAKIKSKKDGSIQEAWINPQQIPMEGLLKMLGNSQFGAVTEELQKFEFGH